MDKDCESIHRPLAVSWVRSGCTRPWTVTASVCTRKICISNQGQDTHDTYSGYTYPRFVLKLLPAVHLLQESLADILNQNVGSCISQNQFGTWWELDRSPDMLLSSENTAGVIMPHTVFYVSIGFQVQWTECTCCCTCLCWCIKIHAGSVVT